MRKVLLYTLILGSFIQSVYAQNNRPVAVSYISYYGIRVKNVSDVHIKVRVTRKGQNELNTMTNPGQEYDIDKVFKKSIARNTSIFYRYDNEMYSIDKREAELKKDNTIKAIDNSKATLEKNINREFLNRAAAAVAASIEIKSDDIFLERLAKWILRNGGRAVSGAYEAKDFYNTFLNKPYRNYQEFLYDLAQNHIEGKIVDELSRVVRENLGTDEKVNKRVINAMMFYVQESSELPKRIQERKQIAQNEYQNRITYISSLRQSSNVNGQYTLIDVLPNDADFRTVTPNFTITLNPVIYGANLNRYWKECSDEFLLQSIGAKLNVAISPEIRLGEHSFSKFYLTGEYSQYSYALDSTIDVRLSKNFFVDVPANTNTFQRSNPFEFYQRNIALGLTYRMLLGRSFIIDLTGGYIQQTGILNLDVSELRGLTWKNPTIEIDKKTYIPYAGLQIGFGNNNFHRGTHITVGGYLFSPTHINSTEYIMTDGGLSKPIYFNSDGISYKVAIGLSFSF
jgi:hypothetical protein